MALTKLQKQAFGLDNCDLVELHQGQKCFLVHHEMMDPWQSLRDDARQAGFELAIVSAFRDFDRQKLIWNAKANGERDIVDIEGRKLDLNMLTATERLFAIMRWSAIPGTSRHHWGTDIDVFDANCMDIEEVQLLPAEVSADGPCGPMHEWLTDHINSGNAHGFFRPYGIDRGGVAPELWHLSYQPVAETFRSQLKPDIVLALWKEKQVALFDALEANIDVVWDRFIV